MSHLDRLTAVHREIDELAKIAVITLDRAIWLKAQLTADVINEYVQKGMSLSELIDLYNDLGAMEAASTTRSSELAAAELALCDEFERFCSEQELRGHDDAMGLLRRPDLTAQQRRWLSDFVRRWAAAITVPHRIAAHTAAHPTIITVFPPATEVKDEHGTVLFTLPRGGVWIWDENRRCHHCFATDDDIDALARRFSVPRSRIYTIKMPPS